MKRVSLVKHLSRQGCLLLREGLREGKKHTVFYNPKSEKTSTVPRHNEINNFLAVKICRDLNISIIKKK